MKNLFLLLALMFLFGTARADTSGHDDYMYFLVDKISLNRGGDGDYQILNGETVAKRIYVLMDNNEFEIDAGLGRTVAAATYLTDKRLYFVKDEIKFSTPLDTTNILYSIEQLSATNAEIELSKKGVSVKGEYLEAQLNKNLFLIKNIDMYCLTDEFTTDVDIACLSETHISPLDGENGYVKVEDLSDANEYRIEINTSELEIRDSRLLIDANRMSGFYKSSEFYFSEGSLKCLKDPTLVTMDVERFVNGCLEETNFRSSVLSLKQPALDVLIEGMKLDIDSGSFKVNADLMKFKTSEGHTDVDNFNYICDKLDIDINNSNTYVLVNGCLKGSHLTVYRFNSHHKSGTRIIKTDKGLIDINDLKNIELTLRERSFELTAKVKIIARLLVRIKGYIELDEQNDEMIIDITKARIAGVPARSFAMFIIKNFIKGDMISVRGNKIIISLRDA